VALLEELGHTDILGLIVSGERNKAIISRMIGDTSRVRVIAPVENIAELYALVDCFVSASRSEGFPYGVGEAMASGLPIVSSDIPQVTIYKLAGEGFLTFRNGDAQDLSRVLAQMLKLSPKELHRLGEMNRHFIKENFTVDRWCRKIIDLYRSLLCLRGLK